MEKNKIPCPLYGIGYLKNVKELRRRLGENAARLWLSASLEGLPQESGREVHEENIGCYLSVRTYG